MKKHIIILLLTLGLSSMAYSQIDTTFWFAAPSLTKSHIPDNIWMVIVTYGDAANVSISQPARPRTLMTERRIEANSTYTYSIKGSINYRNNIETPADQTAHDNGMMVRSDVPISVYYVATSQNSEIYTLKGQHGLGTDFIVPMQNRFKSNHTQPAYCSIEMVATEDNTTITVITTQPTNELPEAGTITITLNRGQTYAIRSNTPNTPAANHLGGTHITSDKPIAVNTTDDSAETGNDKDLVGEQLVPTQWSGNHYIAISNNSTHEYAYFFAGGTDPVDIYTTDGTTETLVGTAMPGQPLEYKLQQLSAQVFYSKDNAPFILFQLTGNGGELSGTVLPSLNCSGSDEVSYIPALNTVASNVTILTRTEFISGFSVNGDAARLPASVFLQVPGAPEWSYTPSTIIQLEGSEKTLRIRNHLGVFHLGVLDATQGAVSYGFFSNFGKIAMSCSAMKDYYYAGEDIQLHLIAADNFDDIIWEGPKGVFGEGEGDPIIHNATMADAGMYVVSGSHKDGCELTPDTFFLTILDTVAFYRKEMVCYGDPVTIESTGEEPFEWFKDDEPMPETTDTYTYTPTTSSTFIISSTTPGIDIFESVETKEYTYEEERDTAVVWTETYLHCMPGVEYVLTVSLGVNGTNPVPPRLLLYVNGVYSEPLALPNNCTGQILTLRFTPQDRYAVMRLVAVNTKIGRHFQVESMSLRPILPLTETVDIDLQPLPTIDSIAILDYCDSLPAYVWREFKITEPGLYKDTSYSMYGCDSVYHILLFDIVYCIPDSITFTMSPEVEICDGESSVAWPIRVLTGIPERATIYLNDSVYTQEITRATTELDIPLQVQPNYYDVKVVLWSPKYSSKDTAMGRLTVYYDPLKVFAQKWDNVLAIFSPAYSGYPDYTWTEYHWYKDNTDLLQSFSYYRIADGTFLPNECYQVLLTRQQDGVTLFTCPYCIPPTTEPTPAQEPKTVKMIRQGQLIIFIDGTEYNAQGERIR